MWPFSSSKHADSEEIIAMAAVIAKLKEENNSLKERAGRYWEQIQELKKGICTAVGIEPDVAALGRYLREVLIKYSIVEDDEYCRIISRQDMFTISFQREFDTRKDNYNWVNYGEALITMRFENVGYSISNPTIIKAPASGIFEFDSNKLIKENDEICRIRKYPQEMRDEVIKELERKAIKEAVLRKERKKMIERETLDELISEGQVFNFYTSKDGNRTSIPMEIATAVWNRDGGKCCICGAKENLEFDHIIPLAKGGATSFRNLQLLCRSCNRLKSDNI